MILPGLASLELILGLFARGLIALGLNRRGLPGLGLSGLETVALGLNCAVDLGLMAMERLFSGLEGKGKGWRGTFIPRFRTSATKELR